MQTQTVGGYGHHGFWEPEPREDDELIQRV